LLNRLFNHLGIINIFIGNVPSAQSDNAMLEIDVTPLSLGIRTAGNLTRKIIERNSIIPCEKRLLFTTSSDFQTKMKITILQGESRIADQNIPLGSFTFEDLPAGPRGAVYVMVTFSIDANGILCASAQDITTGKVHQITVKGSCGLSKVEIERLYEETYKQNQDPIYIKHIDLLERSNKLAYVTRKFELEISEKINKELGQRLRDAYSLLIKALNNKTNDLYSANKSLSQILSELLLTYEAGQYAPKSPKGFGIDIISEPTDNDPFAGFHVLEHKSGGMGSVSLLLKDGRIFAVKSLKDELLRSPGAPQRFIDESRTWIDLGRHTNIVFALLVRVVEEKPYLFLEYADSGDLSQWVGKLPLPMVLDYGIQICSGMSYVYQKANIVHRDLKPANILLSKDDRFKYGYAAKVTDFGLAGIVKPDSSYDFNMISTQLSRGMGTWPYMSPEQFPEIIQNHYGFSPLPITIRSDIYSFGVLLYELITGKPPFFSLQDIFLTTIENVENLKFNVPKQLTDLIKLCLAKSPKMRPASFDELSDELTAIYLQVLSETYNIIGKPEELTHLDWYARGASLKVFGDFREALRCFEKALDLVPSYPPAIQGRGSCYESMGFIDKALQCYDQAIGCNPFQEEAWLGEARCMVHMSRLPEAFKCFERAYEAQLLTSVESE